MLQEKGVKSLESGRACVKFSEAEGNTGGIFIPPHQIGTAHMSGPQVHSGARTPLSL